MLKPNVLGWIAWDEPDKIAAHPRITNGSGLDAPKLVITSFNNGSLIVTATRKPISHLSSAVRLAKAMRTFVENLLVSEEDRSLSRVSVLLRRRLQAAGFRNLGHGLFESLSVETVLAELASMREIAQPPEAPAKRPKAPPFARKGEVMPNTAFKPTPHPPEDGLIPVFVGQIGGVSCNVCNARDLHAFLEVGRDFTNWIKDRIEKYQFVENQDFTIDTPNLANQKLGRGGDRRSVAYLLTLDMAKELSMVENNDKGRIARRYFIECEKKAMGMAAAGAHQPLPQEVEDACETRAWRLVEEWRDQAVAMLGPSPQPEDIEALWMAAGMVKKRLKHRLAGIARDMLVKQKHSPTAVAAWILVWNPPYHPWAERSTHH